MKLYDVLENIDFEDIDICDDTYDVVVAFCLDPENGDKEAYDEVLTKIAKSIDVIEDDTDCIVCDILSWVNDNFEMLDEIFDINADDEDEEMENLVCYIFPGLISGAVSDKVYEEINQRI